MARLGELRDRQTPFLFEGQTRFSFVEEGLRFAGIDNARIVLVDCDDAVRSRRLRRERGQPALANPTMMNWAETLRREARYDILDTSTLTLDQSVDRSALISQTRASPVQMASPDTLREPTGDLATCHNRNCSFILASPPTE
jgi:hypothetical protein